MTTKSQFEIKLDRTPPKLKNIQCPKCFEIFEFKSTPETGWDVTCPICRHKARVDA